MPNTTYGTDGLLATTLKHYIPRLEDNIFSSKPLLWAIRQAGRIQNFTGEQIVQPLIYAEAENKGSYADDDTFSTDPNTGISAAAFPFKQYYGLVSFTGVELAKNSGKEALLSLMKARMQQVEMTIAENLDEMFFGDGSGNAGKDWYGLSALISSADPSWGDLGGIDRTAASGTYWRSTEQAAGTANTLALADMRNVYNDASEGNDHPTNVFTTQTAFESYEALVQADQRFLDPVMGDAGFQNLMFKGAPITFDKYADVSGAANGNAPMWFVNLKYITLAKLNNVWFTPSDVLQPTNQDVFFKHLKCYGNLIISNANRQGVLTDNHA